jgi:hypothetical protein
MIFPLSSSSTSSHCQDHSYAAIHSPDYAIAPTANLQEIENLLGNQLLPRYFEEGDVSRFLRIKIQQIHFNSKEFF